MALETYAGPDDDPAFLACVDRIIAGVVERQAPEEVYVVRIGNWFDHKWLRFSGIGRVPFCGVSIDTALDEFSHEQITFPPFTPNRVIAKHYFCRTARGDFEEASAHVVHHSAREHSPKNLQRRVADFSRSAVFVWFSSHSAVNGRGSVMAYTVCSRHVDAWYAAFSDTASWRLARVKGISRLEIDSFLVSARQPASA